MKNKKGFSLIEVVIATSIISITVFGVYKLIGENTKIINSSGNYLQTNSLFPIVDNCIENYGFNNFSNNKYILSLGENTELNNCNFTTNTGTTIDNLSYIIEISKIDYGSNYIDWLITIKSEDVGLVTQKYKQIKK